MPGHYCYASKGWSAEEVVRRWCRLFPPRDKARRALPVSNDWVAWRLKDAGWLAKVRERLQGLRWFMTCLKSDRNPIRASGG
jgi:hypothetical protein